MLSSNYYLILFFYFTRSYVYYSKICIIHNVILQKEFEYVIIKHNTSFTFFKIRIKSCEILINLMPIYKYIFYRRRPHKFNVEGTVSVKFVKFKRSFRATYYETI